MIGLVNSFLHIQESFVYRRIIGRTGLVEYGHIQESLLYRRMRGRAWASEYRHRDTFHIEESLLYV
jgi:hypothetical protein